MKELIAFVRLDYREVGDSDLRCLWVALRCSIGLVAQFVIWYAPWHW